MSFFEKIKAFFSGKKTEEEVVTKSAASPETLSFNEDDLKNARERNAQQDTRMTEEYENFLKEQYPQDEPAVPTRDAALPEDDDFESDDTLAWDSDYADEE